MAKAELFWFPLGSIVRAGGAFKVRRGEQDEEAIATAIELAREGNAVVMFPEGTRRQKGMRKRHEARWRSGAARIALTADVPLVPAGISGTERLARLGPLRVAYGPPIDTSDRAVAPRGRGRADRDRPAARRDPRARAEPRVRPPLLVMDGDSFTHRAYHALPKSMRREDGGPANALTGFTDMLLRLWREERPRTVLVAWDTLDVPTYRHEALDAYQSGRVFEDELLEQLDLLPEFVESIGFACAKVAGTRRTTSSRPQRRTRKRPAERRSSRPPTGTHSSS